MKANKAEWPLRRALVQWLDAVYQRAATPKVMGADRRMATVNRDAERLLKAFKAAARESVRELPGRAQKGAVDAALKRVAPKIAKALKV